jgi:hypothetical protein
LELRPVVSASRGPIADRLASDPTAGRRDDLAESAEWIARGVGTGFADRVINNDRPVREVADAVLEWLGWPT